MKKLLAICLSVFMVISLMPAVFAVDPEPEAYAESAPFVSGSVVLPARGTLTVQAEDYRTTLFHKVKKSDGSVSEVTKTGSSQAFTGGEGAYLRINNNQDATLKAGTTLTWILDFTAPADGYYHIVTRHGGRITSHNAGANGYVDSTTLFSDTTQASATADAGAFPMQINEKTIYLTAGQYTYKYEVLFTPNNTDMYLDYVSFERLSSEFDVGNVTPTTIQAESYPYTTCVHSDTTTHDVIGTVASGVLTADCTTHADANGTNNWKMTLNVATTGIYDIKTVAGGALTNANGGVEIKLDGEAIITDTVAGALTAVETFAKRVYLAAGEHVYSYTAKSISGKATVKIDYVEITPVVAGTADPDTTVTPVITAPAEILTGATATVSYTYSETNTNPEGESILRVIYKDGLVWKVGLTTTVTGGTGSIEFPDSLAGKEVAVEFIPVDSEGLMGPLTASGSMGTLARAIDTSAAAITPSGSDFNATVTITNNSATLGTQNVCVILVQYDADGAMLAVTNATISVANGVPQTLTPSFAKVTGATKVQMFIWDGTGYLDAGVSTYRTPVTYMVP